VASDKDLNLAITGEDFTGHATNSAGRNFDQLGRKVHGFSTSATKDVEGFAESAESAGQSVGKLSNLAMPALIAAGTILSPVAVTLAAGLGGLAAAAVGTIKPVLESKDGITGLDGEQQRAFKSVQLLKSGYKDFQKSLEPAVVDDFAAGIKLASGLMRDVQPIAKATGTALRGVLGGIDDEFSSGKWQQFFGFMAKEAAPDVRLVGSTLISLLDVLPPLLEDLQPVAVRFLEAANAASRLAGTAATLQHQLRGESASSKDSASWAQRFGQAALQAAGQLIPGLNALPLITKGLDHYGASSRLAGDDSETAAHKVADLSAQLHRLLDPALTASDNLLSVKNAAHDAATALQQSGGQTGYASQKARDAQGALNTLIHQEEQAADQARQAGGASAGYKKQLLNSLGPLEAAARHNSALAGEVAALSRLINNIPTEHTTYIRTFYTTSGNPSGFRIPGGPPAGAADGPSWSAGAGASGITEPAHHPMVANVTSTLVLDGQVIDRRVQHVVAARDRRAKVGYR
jgi:hypothetical protein